MPDPENNLQEPVQDPEADPQAPDQEPTDPLTEAFAIIKEQQARLKQQQEAYQKQIRELLRNGANLSDGTPSTDPNTIQDPKNDDIMPDKGDKPTVIPFKDLGKQLGKRPEKQ